MVLNSQGYRHTYRHLPAPTTHPFTQGPTLGRRLNSNPQTFVGLCKAIKQNIQVIKIRKSLLGLPLFQGWQPSYFQVVLYFGPGNVPYFFLNWAMHLKQLLLYFSRVFKKFCFVMYSTVSPAKSNRFFTNDYLLRAQRGQLK